MKPIFATMIILTALSLRAGADLYPDPGQPSYPVYPRPPHEPPPYPGNPPPHQPPPYPGNPPPHQPPPYPGNPPPHQPPPYPGYPPPHQPPPSYGSYSSCKVEYTGNYYYVSKNGQRFTDLTSSLQQAIGQQQQLQNSGMCEYTYQSPGLCQLEYTGNYYYVSRNGSRMSDLTSDYRQALSVRNTLIQSRNCDQNSYGSNAVCKVEYTGNYYYVSRNGSRFSDLTSSLDSATQLRDDLARNYVCQVQYAQSPCRLEYTGNYYYLSINSQRSTDLTSDLNSILNQQVSLANRGMCSSPQPERCSLEYTGNYYYVARNGSRLSDLTFSMNQASDLLQRLRYSNNCY